ncbi:MAG TPA: amidase [Candidatus Acidoferrales bacterium]|nr:amidase [Candidatus Acidoferrales bacterium]
MEDIARLTLIELTQALRDRRLSAVELMTDTLGRIEATHKALNAVVAMYDRERLAEEARAADARLQRGEARPLEGVPLGVKDLEDAEGLVTSQGSLPFKNNIARRDSVQVERLRRAGAIVVGKTNAPEFGYTAITKNLVYGVTRSPWNLDRTPGGSSGGSAAVMAAGVLPLVTASDGGGSIRIPASFTGTFGLKVSFGRIPRGPFDHWEYQDTSVVGPLTKTVEDAALFMDQVVGSSPWDPNSLPHPGISYLESVRRGLPNKLRIAFSPDLGYAVVQSDVAKAVEENVKVFEKLGHRIERIQGGPPQLGRDWGVLGTFELASNLHELLPKHEADFGRTFLSSMKLGWQVCPESWGQGAKQRAKLNEWCAELFETYDLLITPTVPYDPPPAGGPFPQETEGRPQILAGPGSFTIPFNLSWHPAATVRVGLSRAGLPMGMQIVGRRHGDDVVLQAACAFERERPWHPQWPKI